MQQKSWFFHHTELDEALVLAATRDALAGMDDGECYLEHEISEGLVFDDGRLKSASHHTTQGFGLRGVTGEAVVYAHSSELSQAALSRAAGTVRAMKRQAQTGRQVDDNVCAVAHKLYDASSPLEKKTFDDKLSLLQEIDAYVRGRDMRVRQVSVTLSGSWTHITIVRADGNVVHDVRPLVRLNVSAVLEHDGRMETGSSGAGGRYDYGTLLNTHPWRQLADEALRRADVNMQARPSPAGEMPVLLGNGWCGVLLHEAVGHGLEGDFNRKGSSTFSGRVGQQVAARGVTVVDDGTLPHLRGSLNIDDEGTPTSRTTLIEDGVLTGYMQDRLNARLMGAAPTGNGRRESYAHAPMPRMTNTFMLAGQAGHDDMLHEVKRGIYAPYFGGGQVDITSGKFVFSASEAYLVENGVIQHPVKGTTLIGNGPDVMGKISMIGNDMALDTGIGTCGKDGQSVPVGVGQPSLLISSLTVGGTAA